MVCAFQQAGVSLPRTSSAQFGAGPRVDRANIQAGDLVFFNANGPGASHVGIATSNSTVISRHDPWGPGARDQRLLLGLALRGARRV